MNEQHDQQSDNQLDYLRDLEKEDPPTDVNIYEFREDKWVVYGAIPYAGEVPMAVFDSNTEARQALDDARPDEARPAVTELEDRR